MGRVPPPTSEQKWMAKFLLILALLALILGFIFGYLNPKAKADSVGHHRHRHHHVTQIHNPVKPKTDSNGFTPAQQFGIGGAVIVLGAFAVFGLYRRTYRHHMRHRKLNNKNAAVKAHKKAHDDKQAKAAKKAKLLKGGK